MGVVLDADVVFLDVGFAALGTGEDFALREYANGLLWLRALDDDTHYHEKDFEHVVAPLR